MSNNRKDRVAEEVKKVVSQVVRTEVKDPNLGMVTITDVDMTKELEVATVYFTTLNENKEDAEAALNKAKGLVRSAVAKEIRLRKAPEIEFKYDNSIEYGSRIESLLNEIREK